MVTIPFREILTGIGSLNIQQPIVRGKTEGGAFSSALFPIYYKRRTSSLDAEIPELYLREISTNNFPEALAALLGEKAVGLSAINIIRMKKLARFEFINSAMTLQAFALVNHNTIIDSIKLVQDWAKCSRQTRVACYISFTRFLSRRTHGIIPHAIPNRESGSKTFFAVYEMAKTEAMTQAQWIRFLEEHENISPRECLIAKVILQDGKRVSEVLPFKVHQIDFERKKNFFKQSKMKGLKKETVIERLLDPCQPSNLATPKLKLN